MALRDWIAGKNPQRIATTATTATRQSNEAVTVASVATVARVESLYGDDSADHDREAREERAAIIEFDGGLTRAEAERLAGELRVGVATVATPSRFDLESWGDLRPCLLCRNLTPMGRCLAAWRGELRAARDYAPTFPEQPQRCIGYAPRPGDPNQMPGRERWPELIGWQAPNRAPEPV
jgi:hypothetical protein